MSLKSKKCLKNKGKKRKEKKNAGFFFIHTTKCSSHKLVPHKFLKPP